MRGPPTPADDASPPISSYVAWFEGDGGGAETWREVAEWKRKNLWRQDARRRISVPIPRGAWSRD